MPAIIPASQITSIYWSLILFAMFLFVVCSVNINWLKYFSGLGVAAVIIFALIMIVIAF